MYVCGFQEIRILQQDGKETTYERGIQSKYRQAQSDHDHHVCPTPEGVEVYPLYLCPSAFALVSDVNRGRNSQSNCKPGNREHDDLYEEEHTHRPAEANPRYQALDHDWEAD
jgi:hypothetical protein